MSSKMLCAHCGCFNSLRGGFKCCNCSLINLSRSMKPQKECLHCTCWSLSSWCPEKTPPVNSKYVCCHCNDINYKAITSFCKMFDLDEDQFISMREEVEKAIDEKIKKVNCEKQEVILESKDPQERIADATERCAKALEEIEATLYRSTPRYDL